MTYYVASVRLEKRVSRTPRAKRLNPDAVRNSPCFYVAVSASRSDDIAALNMKRGRGILQTYGMEIDGQSRVGKKKWWGALAAEEKQIHKLRAGGAYVLNEPRPRSNSVYIIRLQPEVGESSGAKKQNPKRDPGKPCLYVGQTGLSHQERFDVHRAGGQYSSKWVHDYGVELIASLNPEPGLMTELDALRAERRAAHALRKDGYTVLGGH